MSTTTVTPVCPCCHQELDCYISEGTRGLPEMWRDGHYMPAIPAMPAALIGTCKSVGCDYRDVTLSSDRWLQLASDEAMQADYRGMYARSDSAW